MDSINAQIHELFENNRALFGKQPISFDGLVSQEIYLNSSIRTIFLLKDINGEEVTFDGPQKIVRQMEHDWEYMDWLHEQALADMEPLYKTWPNVCLWVELLKNPECNYMDCMNSYGTFDAKRLRKNLCEIGIVNIKKTPGGGSSIYAELEQAVADGKELLRMEIDIIAPRLIICGGTFEFAKQIYNISPKDIYQLPSGAEYFKVNERIFLGFVHPMWFSVDRKILFAYARQTFAELKKHCLLESGAPENA